MEKAKANTESQIRASISSLYADLLSKRQSEKEMKKEQKRMEKELREQEKEEKKLNEDGSKMSKKERRQAELDNWKEVVIGLTGDDLEYISDKKKNKKKKYKKWIDDDEINQVLTVKKKKIKKKNYNKEFEPELNMLRTLIAEQNRFTADLQKRFQNAMGPANKDAMPPSKTLVELANVISSGRTNSLGMLREIGNLKKAIADLYMKQKKLDMESGSSNSIDDKDLTLMGSSIASSIFGDNQLMSTPVSTPSMPQPTPQSVIPNVSQPTAVVSSGIEHFDPSSWEGPELDNNFTKYENIPQSIVVKRNTSTGEMRFAAIRDDNGEELVGANIPTTNPSSLRINEDDKTVKGEFDQLYKLIDE